MNIIQLLFSTSGRFGRTGYFLTYFGLLIVANMVKFAGLAAVLGYDAASTLLDDGQHLSHLTPVSIYTWGVTFLFLVPAVCISVRRWHDRNRPGWFAAAIPLVYALIMLLAFIPREDFDERGAGGLYVAILTLLVIMMFWQLIELGSLNGNKGDNKYGPPPKGIWGLAEKA
jgi:uncharacterized membrane protein YhaH (DUF805 family)